MTNDEKMMRQLAYEYQFRKFTNTKDYTESELDDFVKRYKWMQALCNPDRVEKVRSACVKYTSYCK